MDITYLIFFTSVFIVNLATLQMNINTYNLHNLAMFYVIIIIYFLMDVLFCRVIIFERVLFRLSLCFFNVIQVRVCLGLRKIVVSF
jgi:hypothetical protein